AALPFGNIQSLQPTRGVPTVAVSKNVATTQSTPDSKTDARIIADRVPQAAKKGAEEMAPKVAGTVAGAAVLIGATTVLTPVMGPLAVVPAFGLGNMAAKGANKWTKKQIDDNNRYNNKH
ncbi:hypothetical protein BDF19DRAFT_437076, partial [Syncephalis fuscata]